MPSIPDKPEWLRRVTVIGVGLLGGSVGKAMRRRGVFVTGFFRRSETGKLAVEAGAVDQSTTDLQTACAESDVVVIASPVDKIAGLAVQASRYLPPGALITDVGSTKAKIIDELSMLCRTASKSFVAAHPIAGSTATGVQHSDTTLFDGKTIIITPPDSTKGDVQPAPDAALVSRAQAFWQQTGGRVFSMSPIEHDQRLAMVSHVPHLVASVLASLADQQSVELSGTGWESMTHLASGDPEMWTAICEHNRPAILQELDRLVSGIDELRNKIAAGDSAELVKWLAMAKAMKDGG